MRSRQIDAKGCGGAATIAAGAVGSERPGLKPRAQSASPLKGAVRRPGARVDRLGAGAVWISRLEPAWGLSPAVHGRAIVETGARLIGAACRARRVGHVELPRHSARAGEAAPRPYNVGNPSPVGRRCVSGWCHHARPVGAKRCLTRPARQGRYAAPLRPPTYGRRHHRRLPRLRRGRARQRLAPTTWATHPRSGIRVRRVGRSRPSGRGQALPDPSGPPGLANDTVAVRRCAVAVTAGQRRRYSVRRGCGHRHRPSFRRCW